jgi:uncharacterized protein YbbK (DUF523 family)
MALASANNVALTMLMAESPTCGFKTLNATKFRMTGDANLNSHERYNENRHHHRHHKLVC